MPYTPDKKTPLELYEARNAVRIAQWTGADTWAPDALQRAKIALQNAEDEYGGRSTNKKTVQQNSRDAAQTAEDARLITIRKIEDQQTADAQAAATSARGGCGGAGCGSGSAASCGRATENGCGAGEGTGRCGCATCIGTAASCGGSECGGGAAGSIAGSGG